MATDYNALDSAFLLALIEAQEELDDDGRLGHVDPLPYMTREVMRNLRGRLVREEQDALLALSHTLDAATEMDEDERLCFHAPSASDVAHAKASMVRALFGDSADADRGDLAGRGNDRPDTRSLALVAAFGRASSGLRRVPHLRHAFSSGQVDLSPAAPRVRTIEAPVLPGPPELGAAEDWLLSIHGTSAPAASAASPRAHAAGPNGDRHDAPPAGVATAHDRHPGLTGAGGVSRSYRFRRCLKAIVDYIAATAGLVVFSPMLVAIAATIRLTSKGPALFTQPRVGRNGEIFRMIKFRTMYVDGDSRLAELIGNRELSSGQLLKVESDPRVTPVGRVLRKFSLDDFPQMINVLTGSMSIVGPRPPMPTEAARYGNNLRRRLNVKPGLTGLWQVSGRSTLAWDEAVRLDLSYVDNWSLALDARIIWKTFGTMARGDGAY
jgi:lipopolysaccharide/colanic/teichoic acid biosynthesis glycosyltransferase